MKTHKSTSCRQHAQFLMLNLTAHTFTIRLDKVNHLCLPKRKSLSLSVYLVAIVHNTESKSKGALKMGYPTLTV